MAFIKLQFKPGVNRDQTNYSNEGGWYECDKIRFFSGYPQKIGGWKKYNIISPATSVAQYLIGVCREMFNWVTTFGDNIMAYGTSSKTYLEVGGNLYDITPYDTRNYTASLTDPFDTTNTSTTVTVNDTAHGAQTGDLVYFTGASDVGGVPAAELNTRHVITYVDADSYTIEVTTAASSSATGGGSVTASYILDAYLLSNPFAATNGSSTITVTHSSHGRQAGDYVTFSGALTLGGNITAAVLNQNYVIATVPTVNTYTIEAKNATTGAVVTANASDTGNGGTDVYAAYEISVGNAITIYGYGWGAGTWSRGGWGSGTTNPVVDIQRDWFFDNFDNDLVMNYRNGPIYWWERGSDTNAAVPLSVHAVKLSTLAGASDVPAEATQVIVAQNNKHLLAFGCTPYGGGTFDPLLIRWANQDDPANWTPLATNSAGFLRVSRGSYIVQALPTRQEILVFTDSTLSSLQFLGTTDVFGLQELADNISIISPRAAISANNITYWMGQDKFYVYSGAVNTMPCTLRQHVFSNLNYEQSDQVIAGTNEGFSEIWWFYPTGSSTTPNAYVIFNYLENIWYYGDLTRTAWLDTPLRQYPQSVGSTGIVYNQEQGVDDDTSPMESYIQSSDFDISEGDQLMLTRRIVPDLNFSGSSPSNLTPTAYLTLAPKLFPGSTPMSEPNLNVIETSANIFTDQVFIRARGRSVAFKVGSVDLGVQWQLGDPRLDARTDGKR